MIWGLSTAAFTLVHVQKEPPFVAAQLVVLVLFGALAVLAARRFRTEGGALSPAGARRST